jgi:hypothetical protein
VVVVLVDDRVVRGGGGAGGGGSGGRWWWVQGGGGAGRPGCFFCFLKIPLPRTRWASRHMSAERVPHALGEERFAGGAAP